jgi:DNA gyrase subunit A
MDLPVLDQKTPKLGQGTSLKSYLGLGPADGSLLAVVNLEDAPVLALGTQRGVVKRVSLAELPDRPRHTLISLKDGDTVVGAAPAAEDHHVVFVTTRGALLNFPAHLVRPQGLAAGGMQGMSVPEDSAVLAMTAVLREKATVITLSGSTEVLPGTESQRAKRTALTEFPVKGRATSGVRAHSFLKGEDALTTAYVGYSPLAMGSRGQAVELPVELAKRDASGTVLEGSVSAMGEQLS